MQTTLIEKYQFETGDLFFVVAETVRGSYRKGDFLLIKLADPGGACHHITNSKTITGLCATSRGSSAWLEEMLKAGIFEYQGNLKV